MLDVLDIIDWDNLLTSYGSASEIPGAIRALRSDDKEEREYALGTLRHLLEHQGLLCEATSLAVPFLLEALADSRLQKRRSLIDLLTYLCSWRRYGEMYLMLEQRAEERRKAEERKSIPPGVRDLEQEWKDETHQALRAGLPLICS